MKCIRVKQKRLVSASPRLAAPQLQRRTRESTPLSSKSTTQLALRDVFGVKGDGAFGAIVRGRFLQSWPPVVTDVENDLREEEAKPKSRWYMS
jgi:hypothetical protein